MARVKADILVSAALRYANEAMIDCVLQHRGDADAGAIYVHIDALWSSSDCRPQSGF